MEKETTATDAVRIMAMEPRFDAVHVVLQCGSCSTSFQVLQSSVTGLAFGKYACPSCRKVFWIEPDTFSAARDRLWPELPDEVAAEIVSEASRIAQQWSSHPKIAKALTYEGIALGPLTSFTSFKFIAKGLSKIQAGK